MRKFYQKKRIMIPLSIGLALIFLGVIGAIISSLYLTTSNAYVSEYLIPVQSKIEGKIIELNLQEGMNVKKGEILAELESNLDLKRVEQLENDFSRAQQELKSFEDEISKINIKMKQAQKNIDVAKQNLENANNDYVLYKIQFKDGTVTKKDLEKAIKNLELAQVEFEEAQAQVGLNSSALEKIVSKKDIQLDEMKTLIHELEQAKLELSFATIIAQKSGIGIELNTAGWFKECEEQYPSLALLKEANARKIPVIVNADAHDPAHLQRNFTQAAEILCQAGYPQRSFQ